VFGDCDCLLAFIFAAIESNVDGFDEGDNFEDFEEDQGQATQGKPPKASHLYLLHILILVLFMQVFPFMFIQRCIVL
jgi:hypothetical protein